MLQENSFNLQLILFAIVAVVAAFPEFERERRGVVAAPALAAVPLAPAVALAPKVAPAIALAPAPRLLAARKYFKYLVLFCIDHRLSFISK